MTGKYTLPISVGLVALALTVFTTAWSAGCVYERCECPCALDGGTDGDGDVDGDSDGDADADWLWDGWEIDSAPDGEIVEVTDGHDYLTLDVGGSIELTGRVTACGEDLDARFAPCTIEWDFGNGETGTGETPGSVTFSAAGHYVVSMTTVNAMGAPDLTPAEAHIVVWDGDFSDDFNRASLDYDADGWQAPLDPSATTYSIDSNMLHLVTDAQVPGTTAIMAWPTMGDAHIEVTQERQPAGDHEHYTDIICRMDPEAMENQFYRVRLWEMPADSVPDHTDCVGLNVFKCTPERGNLGTEAWAQGLHHVCEWPRDRNFRLIVDVVGTTFTASLEDPAAPGVSLLDVSYTDTEGDAWTSGRFGLAHYDGVTRWDDWTLQSLD